MSQTIAKAGWVHIVGKRILCGRNRGKEKFYLPGGKLDAGERAEQALVRELREELKIHVQPETIRYLVTFEASCENKPEGTLDQLMCYTAEYVGEITHAAEVQELRWMNYHDKAQMRLVEQELFDWLKVRDLID
jgi:8-oxo-dGTP diphosphatase